MRMNKEVGVIQEFDHKVELDTDYCHQLEIAAKRGMLEQWIDWNG